MDVGAVQALPVHFPSNDRPRLPPFFPSLLFLSSRDRPSSSNRITFVFLRPSPLTCTHSPTLFPHSFRAREGIKVVTACGPTIPFSLHPLSPVSSLTNTYSRSPNLPSLPAIDINELLTFDHAPPRCARSTKRNSRFVSIPRFVIDLANERGLRGFSWESVSSLPKSIRSILSGVCGLRVKLRQGFCIFAHYL